MKQRYQKLCSATLRTLDLQNTGKGWFSIKEKVTYRRDFFFYYFFTKNLHGSRFGNSSPFTGRMGIQFWGGVS